jgi:hypothetical protein
MHQMARSTTSRHARSRRIGQLIEIPFLDRHSKKSRLELHLCSKRRLTQILDGIFNTSSFSLTATGKRFRVFHPPSQESMCPDFGHEKPPYYKVL